MKIIANWFVDPTRILRILKIRKRIDRHADWQELGQLPFGELAYDYEEGLKIAIPLGKLKEAVWFVRGIHKRYGIPFKEKGFYTFQCQLNEMGKGIPTHEKLFKSAGLTRDREFSFTWNLVK
jgi:hypothetical protein